MDSIETRIQPAVFSEIKQKETKLNDSEKFKD